MKILEITALSYTKSLLFAMILTISTVSASAATLLDINFSGTPNSVFSTITLSDSQIEYINPGVTFSSDVLIPRGGTLGTVQWIYNSTGTGLLQTDLYHAQNTSGPTRLDLYPNLAATGFSYTISTIEVDVINSGNIDVSFQAAKFIGATKYDGTSITTVTPGSTGTFSLNVSDLNLTADDVAFNWNNANGLRVAFWSAGVDNANTFEISSIRLVGTVVPEPKTSALLLGMGVFGLIGLRLYRQRFRKTAN